MLKLLKDIRALIAKGFATAAEKADIAARVKELPAEEQEAVNPEAAAAAKLPEEAPESDEKAFEQNVRTIVTAVAKAAAASEVSGAIAAIKTEVKSFVESELAELKAKFAAQPKDLKEKQAGYNAYLRSFFTAVLNKDIEAIKAIAKVTSTKELTTDATGSPYGGFVVDRELSAEIHALITEYGVARQEFTTVPLAKNSYDANTLVTDVTVYWVDEAGQIGSTQAVLGQESLELKKLGAIATLTRELLEDSEIPLFNFLGTRVGEGFAKYEDRAFFMGEGSGDTANAEFTGAVFGAGNDVVIPVRGTKDGSAFSHVTADDLLAMQDASPQWVARNGKYYMHRSIRNLVRAFKDDNGAPIYQSPSENGPATIWGRPVVEVEVMPATGDSAADTAFIMYADLKKGCLFGFKNAIAADRFNAGIVRNVANNADINLITTDREAVRWVERVGNVVLLPSAITVLKTSTGS